MNLPLRFIVLIMLALIVLLAVFLGIINPIQLGVESASNTTQQNSACSNWSLDDCSATSKYLKDVEIAFNCISYEDCRRQCSNIGYCLV